jgi:hypothetical protein
MRVSHAVEPQRRRSRASHVGGAAVATPPDRGHGATPAASDDLVQAFLTRTGRALTRIAARMPRERLVAAVGAATDTDVLFRSLEDAAAFGAEVNPDTPDPLTAALLRGAERKRAMLRAEGGVLSAQQLAHHLGITPQGVGRKRERNQVFWVDVGDGYVYPAFQIGASGLLAGVREVLAAFRVSDPWMRVNFMLTGDRRLDDRRPIDVLRAGAIADVVRAAAAYGEQGAA